MRTFWLSFVNPDAPEGQRFSGACVVDVVPEFIEQAKRALILEDRSPNSAPIAAAIQLAWELGINPGGAVQTCELQPKDAAYHAPRGRLLRRAELEELKLI